MVYFGLFVVRLSAAILPLVALALLALMLLAGPASAANAPNPFRWE